VADLIVITINYFAMRVGVDRKFFVTTLLGMAKKKARRGAPKKSPDKAKGALIQIRVNDAEKQAFTDAADLDGKKLSEWVRDRLRRLAREELEGHGRTVAFLPTA
jgi:hypothetical protein